MSHYPIRNEANPSAHRFMFATGIENSYPIIKLPGGSVKRVDELEKTDFYRRWREDFALVKDLGIEYLRYGAPYYCTHLASEKYDWAFSDETFGELQRLGITPLADLCHFGVPDWIGNFQNPDFPALFAAYAEAFARRFPHIRFYTPVNEIYIAATFSAQLGWWNERLASDGAFVTALKNLVKANLLAEEAILRVRPNAIFIQSESTEYFHPGHPKALERADFLNEKRFLSLDLCYGADVHAAMYEYLLDNGMTRDEYHWFRARGRAVKPFCVMGNDYYWTNEHLVPETGWNVSPSGEIFGYYVITKQYFERYHLPVMHTETNLADAEKAPDWLWKEWANMMRLKADGVPIIGFTWYSLIDQVDWDTALREDNGNINPLGLFDINRKIRPVGAAYKKLVEQWRETLPTESLCLDMAVPTQDGQTEKTTVSEA
jgi:beta-glucosidase/6-phospho-beta-glucosidase/beta-galactosidase